MVAHHTLKIRIGPVVAIRPGDRNVSQRRGAEAIAVFGIAGHRDAATVGITAGLFSGTQLGQADGVKRMVGLERAGMATGAVSLAIEHLHPRDLLRVQRVRVAPQVAVKGAVDRLEFIGLEFRKGAGHIGEMQLSPRRQKAGEAVGIGGNRLDPLAQQIPDTALTTEPLVARSQGNGVFLILPGHFVETGRRHHRLSCQGRGDGPLQRGPFRHAHAEGRMGIGLDPAVVEHRPEFIGPKVEQRGRIARDPRLGGIAGIDPAIGAQIDRPFAQPKRHAISRGQTGMVTGGAGDVAISRKDRIKEQVAAQQDQRRIGRREVRLGHRFRQVGGQRECGQERQKAGGDPSVHAVPFRYLVTLVPHGGRSKNAKSGKTVARSWKRWPIPAGLFASA